MRFVLFVTNCTWWGTGALACPHFFKAKRGTREVSRAHPAEDLGPEEEGSPPRRSPQTDAAQPSDTPQFISVALDREGRYFFGDEAVSAEAFALRVTAAAKRNAQAEVVAVDWAGVLQVATENATKMGVAARSARPVSRL